MKRISAPKDLPLFWLALAYLIWGELSQRLWLAIPLMLPVLYFAWRRPKVRVRQRQFQSLWDFCFVCCLAFLISLMIDNQGPSALRPLQFFLSSFPLLFYPIVLVRSWGGLRRVQYFDLLFLLRLKFLKSSPWATKTIDVAWFNLWLCLIAASVPDNQLEGLYFPAVVLLLSALVLSNAKRHCGRTITFVVLLLTMSLAYGLQLLIFETEAYLNAKSSLWFGSDPAANRFRQSTSLGRNTELQRSSAITLRWRAKPQEPVTYLRASVYDQFLGRDTWLSSHGFKTLAPTTSYWYSRNAPDQGSALVSDIQGQASSTLWLRSQGFFFLPLPDSALSFQVRGTEDIERVGQDSIRIDCEHSWCKVELGLSHHSPAAKAPPERYLNVPSELEALFKGLELPGISETEALGPCLKALQNYFSSYRYDLKLAAPPKGVTPLAYFLKSSRCGHCEYFATATVLWLRSLGHKARYVQGYLVREQQGAWSIARGRDAHAWCEVWNGSNWQIVETTPASPTEIPWHQGAHDWWQNLVFHWQSWRFQGQGDRLLTLSPWLLALTMLYFLVRLLMDWRRFRRDGRGGRRGQVESDPGFLAIEERLGQRYRPRLQNESWQQWSQALSSEGHGEVLPKDLVRLWERWAWSTQTLTKEERDWVRSCRT